MIADDIAATMANISTLTSLTLQTTSLNDDGVQLLAQHPHLTTLNLNNCTHVTDACTGSLSTMPNLMTLCVAKTDMTSLGVSVLSKSDSIHSLDISTIVIPEKEAIKTFNSNTTITSLKYVVQIPDDEVPCYDEVSDDDALSTSCDELEEILKRNTEQMKKKTKHCAVLMMVLFGWLPHKNKTQRK